MDIIRWNPFHELEDIQTRLNRFFNEVPARRLEKDGLFFADWAPLVDIQETDQEYLIKAELPEVKKEDVKVEVLDGVLTIEGERTQEKEEKGKKFHRLRRTRPPAGFPSLVRDVPHPSLPEFRHMSADRVGCPIPAELASLLLLAPLRFVCMERVAAVAKTAVSPSLTGSETILVAEDHDGLRSFACKTLESCGYRTLAAKDAHDAMRVIDSFAGPIHLLLTDVVMPGKDGLDLSREVTERRSETRILYISGHADDAIERHGLNARSLKFLQKPFSRDVLARSVREALQA